MEQDRTMSEETKLSQVEGVKAVSNYLRGSIAEELRADTDHFNKDDSQLLKFHGTYQQDDREQRKSSDGGKSAKAYSYMIRTRIPGGRLTCAQILAHLDLCDELGNSTMKLTTRQAIQLHGIVKGDLWKTIHRINEIELSTLAACGDVNRNVMCCPAPYVHTSHRTVQKLAYDLAMHLAPRTKAYYELWVADPETCQEQLVGGSDEVIEPIYGKVYLPRKFKAGVCLPEDNCIDIYTQDLGFLAVVRNGDVIGYNVLVGGGMGTTPSAAKTFPALARRMAFATPEQALGVAEAVVKVQRDYGNREDRKVARLKYLIANRGIEWFRDQVESYFGQKLADCTEDDVHGHDDHIGWDQQGDGKWFYGFNVENGRLYDDENRQWKKAFREICDELNPGLCLTAHQSILFTDIADGDRTKLESIIKRNSLPLSEEISTVRRWSIACVALPTCGLAITESERVLPEVMDEMEKVLDELQLDKEWFTVRMTGCPNGCARPYNAEIGLVGKAKGKYTVFVGGSRLGTRLNFIFKDMIPLEQIVSTLRPLFVAFKEHRQGEESFGDFCDRVGKEQLLAYAGDSPVATTN